MSAYSTNVTPTFFIAIILAVVLGNAIFEVAMRLFVDRDEDDDDDDAEEDAA